MHPEALAVAELSLVASARATQQLLLLVLSLHISQTPWAVVEVVPPPLCYGDSSPSAPPCQAPGFSHEDPHCPGCFEPWHPERPLCEGLVVPGTPGPRGTAMIEVNQSLFEELVA